MARKLAISILWSVALLLFWSPVMAALDVSLNDDRYVQIAAAPVIFEFLNVLGAKANFHWKWRGTPASAFRYSPSRFQRILSFSGVQPMPIPVVASVLRYLP
jgi:hypothetical protein